MKKELTNIERHKRIFAIVVYGFVLIGAIRFLILDPSWMKFMVAIAPIVISTICIYIAGMDYFRVACLVSVVVTTAVDMVVLSGRLGGWGHQRFWMMMLFLVCLNTVIYLYTVVALLALVRKTRRSRQGEKATLPF